MNPAVTFRTMSRDELSRVAEIDRHEGIEVLYEQQGAQLIERHGRWDAARWDPDGTGEHPVAAKVRETEQYVDGGGVVVGAFADDRLVGMGIVVPHLRPQIAQLAFLRVSARSAGLASAAACRTNSSRSHATSVPRRWSFQRHRR